MSQSKPWANLLLKVLVWGFLPFTLSLNASAQSVDRIEQLEKELLEIKLRLTKLEAAQGNTSGKQTSVATGDSWKSLSNWRKLKTDMSPSDVRALLGEPNRLDGGVVARWHYGNRSYVVFIDEKVQQWQEPQQN